MTEYQTIIRRMREVRSRGFSKEYARDIARENHSRLGCTIKSMVEECERQNEVADQRHEMRATTTLSLQERLRRYLSDRAIKALDTMLPYGIDRLSILDRNVQGRVVLLGSSGWYEYSRKAGTWYYDVSVLSGVDEGQVWAIRVPGRCNTIADALAAIEPAAVRKARDAGRWVGRQGDIYLVELQRGPNNMRALPYSHAWDASARTLSHGEHSALQVPDEVRAVRAYRQIDKVSGNGGLD